MGSLADAVAVVTLALAPLVPLALLAEHPSGDALAAASTGTLHDAILAAVTVTGNVDHRLVPEGVPHLTVKSRQLLGVIGRNQYLARVLRIRIQLSRYHCDDGLVELKWTRR